ncbi:arylamine N-acetyltransferase family protein [Larkinella humicola]|uniref:Arylamine N-acetyltransferase n=1 Tax=Larkinella humicola TaxID=2607654 RepID=A0A5N1JKR9_9BACT|nr:arylamine N-acetyltransferase [Larkinella humicola]KAA9355291.1 arylamine N-acetyltransferase [Larkinella humicola]
MPSQLIPQQEPAPATSGIDLDAYFQRIGYTGDRTPTLETLRTLQRLHTESIPFENLNPLLGLPVLLDSESLQQKMVQRGRGGYCFEQNRLLSFVLQTLGFRVRGLAARVLWNVPEGSVKAISHMLLQVEVGPESYLVDVGFGGLSPTGPVRLELNTVQETPHEPFRLIESNGELEVQAEVRNEWRSLYRFTLREFLLPDYEMFSYYLCSHPNSYFLRSLAVARTTVDRRYGLRDTVLTTHHLGGESEQRELRSVAEFRTALEEIFRLTLPDTPDLDKALQKLIDQTAEEK